ncbi:MAG: nucleoside triphosphate pyrophosphohydrolase, partial [Deltaproteobacteria bacterium]|nr:nucleoside triphosphate pyrophosphohydrolase [Deltaproteobacteria bacterium]
PWDREQTMESLTPFVIEEAYEVVGAIDKGSPDMLKEELGDLLFQIIFLSQLAKEKGDFEIGDVIESAAEKMIRRHPHVFGEAKARDSEEVLEYWARIKEAEGKKEEGYLSGVPAHLPALLKAHKVSEKAAAVGFDWRDVRQVFDKVLEELEEFKETLRKGDTRGMEEELGDLLFSLVNVGRFIEVNPEEALRKTIGRFINRFHQIEIGLAKKGKDLTQATLVEMEGLWEDAKLGEKEKP